MKIDVGVVLCRKLVANLLPICQFVVENTSRPLVFSVGDVYVMQPYETHVIVWYTRVCVIHRVTRQVGEDDSG